MPLPFFIEKFQADTVIQCDGVKSFCSYGLEKTSMDSHDAAAACYELTMLGNRRTQPLSNPNA